MHSSRARHYGEILFNLFGTHVPSHRVRQAWLRALGARIGKRVSIFRGTTVLSAASLVVGDRCSIGWRCVLDARGGVTIGDDVSVASDSQLITAEHDPQSVDFDVSIRPITVGTRAWLATRSLILPGVTIGDNAVVAAGAVVRHDVPDGVIVGGVPARPIGERADGLRYHLDFVPKLY